jgi:hypothetical protein
VITAVITSSAPDASRSAAVAKRIPAIGAVANFGPVLDQVEGLVRVSPGGGSSPLGRTKRALQDRAFVYTLMGAAAFYLAPACTAVIS